MICRHLGLPGDEGAFALARHFAGAGLGDGSLPPVPIDREFKGLESLPGALAYLASNQAAGKIVVTLRRVGCARSNLRGSRVV